MDEAADKPVIGIASGIGAGKSTVAGLLGELGCEVIDADRLGHEVLADPDVQRAIGRTWGERVLRADGSVDRRRLAEIVFDSRGALARLNAILHPRIRRLAEARIAAARRRADVPAVVLDAPVLFEAGWNDLCTHLVFVRTPDDVRRQRVRDSRGWDTEHWRSRENSQISLDKKAAGCDYVVENSSSVPHLREQVRQLFHQILESRW